MSAKKRVVLGLLDGLGLSQYDVQKILCSIDAESDWADVHVLLDRLHALGPNKHHRWTSEKICRALENAEGTMRTYRYHNIHVVGQWEELYPTTLQRSGVSPPIIFVQGDVYALHHIRSIALVGSRTACFWSHAIQKRLARLFVERGYGIISGLAKGLDTASHVGCLQAKGKTIAVLPHGFGRSIYPKENQKLAQEIVNKEGCLVSMFGWRKPPLRKRFLERNRVQVGLSQGVVFTAASTYGGTSHTIRVAENLRVPIGYFFHERRTWEPRALNDYYASWHKGVKLDSLRGIEVFLEQVSDRSL